MRENLLKKQPTWGLRRAQGTGQKSATPATLTKVILVLLTMFLLPSAAWGQETVTVIKTITFNKGKENASATTITENGKETIPVTVNEKWGEGEPTPYDYNYDSNVTIENSGALLNYTYTESKAIFTLWEQARTDQHWFIIRIPGNYPATPSEVKLFISYDNAFEAEDDDDEFSAKIEVGDQTAEKYTDSKTYDTFLGDQEGLSFLANGTPGSGRSKNGDLEIWIALDGNDETSPTFTIRKIEMTYETDSYDLSIAGVPVTGVNADNILGDNTVAFTGGALKLNGASISGGGIYTTLENLEINLVNTNTIETGSGTTGQETSTRNGIMSTKNGTLTFVAASNASLEITSTAAAIKGFQTINGNLETQFPYTIKSRNDNYPNHDLYRTCEIEGDSVAITWMKISDLETYPLWIGGYQVNANNKDHILGSGNTTVTFSPTSSPATLTLNNANYGPSVKGIVWSGGGNLKIQFSGNNIINTYGGELNAGEGYCILGNSSSELILSASDNARTLTLKPNSGDTPESYYSKAAISGFTNVSLDDDWGSYYTDNYTTANLKSLTAGKEVLIAKPYGLTVAGVKVTSANYEDILDDDNTGTVSFTPAEGASLATLTLTGAILEVSTNEGAAIESNLTDLTVYLVGDNLVRAEADNSSIETFYAFKGNGSNTIHFTTNAQNPGTITGQIREGDEFSLYTTSSISYQEGLSLNRDNDWFTIGATTYGLTIAGTELTSMNVGSDGTVTGIEGVTGSVKYDYENHKLTLTNAKIEGSIECNEDEEDLTIEINGTENSLITEDGPNIITEAESSNLYFTKGTSLKATLTLNNGIDSSFGNSSSPDELVSGLYFIPGNEVGFAVTTEAWNLKVFASMGLGLTTVHNLEGYPGYKDNISGETTATIKFDGEQILTINGGSIPESTEGENSYTSIISGLDNLTIKLSGDGNYQNTISGKIKSTNSDAKLTFTSEDDNSLFLGNGSPIEGFKGNPSFKNGLVYLPYGQSVGVNIKKLNIPSMRLVDGNLTLDNYGDGENDITCAYTIEYTDGTKETGEYNPDQPKAINKPCVVTAHAVYEDIFGTTNTGDDAVGKYFGAKQEVFGMAIGDKIEGTDWFVPAISTDDGLSCDFTSESGVFTSENGVLSAVESGTGIVSATLEGPSNTPYTILNGSYAITLVFNVGEDLDEYFVDDNEYGTYYNEEENITYAVPEGMKAYIIKSVSDDGTVDLAESTVLSPKTPLLLKKGTAKSFTKISTSTGSAPSGNILKYAADWDQKPSATRSLYVLYNDKFVKVTNNTSVRERKCYLELSGSAGTRGFYNIGGGEGSTGIYAAPIFEEDATETGNSKGWHDLQGRKLQSEPTKPGLYILNGKKIVVK